MRENAVSGQIHRECRWEAREQKQEAKRRIAKTSIYRNKDVFRHNGCSELKASFEKGSETRSKKRKGKEQSSSQR